MKCLKCGKPFEWKVNLEKCPIKIEYGDKHKWIIRHNQKKRNQKKYA